MDTIENCKVKIRVLPDGRVNRQDAAKFLGFAPRTLVDWNRLGKGPRPRKVGGRCYYFIDDLRAFRDTGAREAALV